MDLISRVLSLVPVTGRLDERCNFGAPWEISQNDAAAREIPYHVLLSGNAVLDSADGASERLLAGDIVLFPSGGAHRIHDGSGKPALPPVTRPGVSFVTAVNEGGGAHADILCGRLLIGAAPQQLLQDYLPGRLIVRTASAIADGLHDDIEPAASRIVGTRLARLIALMKEETTDDAPGAESVVNHLSAVLFALTLRFASTVQQPPPGLLALSARPRLQAAISAMFESPEKHWTLEQFAALCNMSKATFVRQFQDAIGRSATDVLIEVRMTMASRLLLQSQSTVAEVAERVGYQSEAAFQRIFKRFIGVTPSRYRITRGEVA